MTSTMTFANRYISNTKEATLHWKSRENNTLSVAGGQAGQVYIGGAVQCTSPLYNIGYARLADVTNDTDYHCHNWDVYSSKYQRCRVRKVEVSCDFFIEQDFVVGDEKVQALVSNADFYLVGMFLTESDPTTPPLTPSPFNWEKLKRVGNCVYRRYQKNVSGSLRVKAMVSIPGALQYHTTQDVSVRVYPTANIVGNTARKVASYPVIGNLYCVVFVVPQTRTLGPNTPVQVNYRLSTKKHVTYTRPISDIYQTYSLLQYPPYSTALPVGFEPRGDIDPFNEAQNIRLTDLENRMDDDDMEDENAIIALEDNIEELDTELDNVADQAAQDLQDHADMKANQAHG